MNISRTELAKQLPLETPLSVHIFPIYICNFKCKYCLHSMSKEELTKKGFKKQIMEFSTLRKAVDDIKEYPQKLKALIFAGHGEPLLHKDICKMVKYAKDADIAERIEIVTNASLLTKEMSDGLIAAGIDRLKISIQGTDETKYQKVSDYKMNYDEFLSNLKYFKENKKHTQVYIKIIDIALEGKDDEAKFKKLFTPVANYVDIEYAIPFINELDGDIYNKDFDRCKQGNKRKSEICSMPFYMQVVTPTGDVVPCCSSDVPISFGNISEESMKQIWMNKKNLAFQRTMLTNKNNNPVCKACCVPEYGLQEGDYLDDFKIELLEKYEG